MIASSAVSALCRPSLLGIGGLLALVMLAIPRGAAAHETRTVADDYEFVVGFVTEPAIAGEVNGVLLEVASDDQPVEGLSDTLQAQIMYGGTRGAGHAGHRGAAARVDARSRRFENQGDPALAGHGRCLRVSRQRAEHSGEWQITLILRERGAAPTSAVAERTIGTTTAEADLPGTPWRFATFGGMSGLLLLIIGIAGIVVAVYAGSGRLRKESGGIGLAALAIGAIMLLQARVDPVLAGTGSDDAINPDDTAMVARGEAVYAAACLSCHGADLRGSGPDAVGMYPPPADFSKPHTRVHPVEDLASWIRNGKPGTAMPGFAAALSDQDIRDVLSYIEAEQRWFGGHDAAE